jgi:hypothetical protein
MPQRLLLVVPEPEVVRTKLFVDAHASRGWEDLVRVESGPVRREPGRDYRDVSRSIIDLADSFGATQTIVAKDIWCDSRIFKERSDLNVQRRSVALIRRNLRDELESLGLLWRKILASRLVHYSQRKTDPASVDTQIPPLIDTANPAIN